MTRKRTKFKVSTTKQGVKDRQSKDYKTGEIITFDSKLEKRYYDEVVVVGMESGMIKDYKLQVRYNLQPPFKYMGKTIRPIDYISDFDVYYANGDFEVVDVKGLATSDAKIKRKLFYYNYPDITFKWMAHTVATGWLEYDELQKVRRKQKKKVS